MKQLSCFLGCLVYLIGYSAFEVTNLGDVYSWQQAMEACGSMGGNLPEVTILANSLGQTNDIQHKNICIWLKAAYGRADNLTDDTYPYSCCEMMFRDQNGNVQKDCARCLGRNRYRCASGNNTISTEYFDIVNGDIWRKASQHCSTHSLSLPSDTNTEFLGQLQYNQVMWVNGVRTLNTNPTKDDGMFPVCSCDGLVLLTCPSNARTFCVHESMNTEIFWASYVTSPVSASLNLPNTSTRNFEDVSNLDATETTRENGALIGGVVGAGVVLTIIIIILVVFLLRRPKQKQNKNSNSQGPVNHDNVLNAKIHVNDAYDHVNGEVTYSDKHTSIEIQHLQRESITYETPSNVKGSSEIIQDKHSGIITNGEQMMTVLYSMVQKRPKAGQNLDDMNQSTVGDDEYDKISFDKSYAQQAEHLGHVYDQTNVNCEHREEYFENVYNKAEFVHKRQNIDAGDVYNKANFHGGQQDKRSENAHSDEESASPGQISENVYDKADFHHRPQDESSGYL